MGSNHVLAQRGDILCLQTRQQLVACCIRHRHTRAACFSAAVPTVLSEQAPFAAQRSTACIHWRTPCARRKCAAVSACQIPTGVDTPIEVPDDGFRDQALLVSSPDAALATASGFLTLFWGVLGDLVSMAPDKAGELVFGITSVDQEDPLLTVFKALAPTLELAAAYNWFQKTAAEQGKLGECEHVRSSAALTVFSACALALLLGGVLGDYTLNPAGAVPLAVLLLFQQLVAAQAFRHGTGSIGALQLPSAMQSLAQDTRRLPRLQCVGSSLYGLFSATFLAIGLSFLALPEMTKTGMLGDMPMTAEHTALWRLLGIALATILAPITFTQQEAALQKNFGSRPRRLLTSVLALTSGAFVFTMLPLLLADRAGDFLIFAMLPWWVVCVISTMVTIKPRESEGWFTPW